MQQLRKRSDGGCSCSACRAGRPFPDNPPAPASTGLLPVHQLITRTVRKSESVFLFIASYFIPQILPSFQCIRNTSSLGAYISVGKTSSPSLTILFYLGGLYRVSPSNPAHSTPIGTKANVAALTSDGHPPAHAGPGRYRRHRDRAAVPESHGNPVAYLIRGAVIARRSDVSGNILVSVS